MDLFTPLNIFLKKYVEISKNNYNVDYDYFFLYNSIKGDLGE